MYCIIFIFFQKITVTAKSGDWWTGTTGDRSGVFPFNYVEPYVEVRIFCKMLNLMPHSVCLHFVLRHLNFGLCFDVLFLTFCTVETNLVEI